MKISKDEYSFTKYYRTLWTCKWFFLRETINKRVQWKYLIALISPSLGVELAKYGGLVT